MAGKYKELAEVLKQECIAPDIYSMWLQTDKIAEQHSKICDFPDPGSVYAGFFLPHEHTGFCFRKLGLSL